MHWLAEISKSGCRIRISEWSFNNWIVVLIKMIKTINNEKKCYEEEGVLKVKGVLITIKGETKQTNAT